MPTQNQETELPLVYTLDLTCGAALLKKGEQKLWDVACAMNDGLWQACFIQSFLYDVQLRIYRALFTNGICGRVHGLWIIFQGHACRTGPYRFFSVECYYAKINQNANQNGVSTKQINKVNKNAELWRHVLLEDKYKPCARGVNRGEKRLCRTEHPPIRGYIILLHGVDINPRTKRSRPPSTYSFISRWQNK